MTIFLKVFLIPLVLYGLYLGYQSWQAANTPEAPVVEYGLTASLPEDINLYGQLMLTAAIQDSADTTRGTYVYDFREKFATLLVEEESATDASLSIVSTEGQMLTLSNGAVIDNAWSGVVVSEGAGVMYVTTDGIYVYDVAEGAARQVFARYRNLTPADMLTTTYNGSTIVFTSPARHLIAIINFDLATQQYIEVGAIVNTNVTYTYPVFNPNGLFYAVVATEKDGSEERIEFRYLESNLIIDRVIVEWMDQIAIADWQW